MIKLPLWNIKKTAQITRANTTEVSITKVIQNTQCQPQEEKSMIFCYWKPQRWYRHWSKALKKKIVVFATISDDVLANYFTKLVISKFENDFSVRKYHLHSFILSAAKFILSKNAISNLMYEFTLIIVEFVCLKIYFLIFYGNLQNLSKF